MDLSKVRVEPIYDYHDREYAGDLLSRYHPLGQNCMKGNRLVYSASYRGTWLGVLCFDQSVMRNKRREARIGWSDTHRASRLRYVVNNSRYLVLPEFAKTKNLASKILSLTTDRLSADWEQRYGYPILAVETYVDPEQNNNTGACYEAAGWENLGYSTGYQKSAAEERTHSKWYLLKALHKDSFAALRAEVPHALITGAKSVSGASNNNYVLDASKLNLQSLRQALSAVPDPRSAQGRRYEITPMLTLCVAATLSGYTQYRQIADWIAKLPLETRIKVGMRGNKVPTESTVAKLLSRIDPDKLQSVLTCWLMETYNKELKAKILALDGKAIRATAHGVGDQMKFLNVFVQELGIVLHQAPTKGGSGENSTATQLVKESNLFQDKLILADAIHTEQKFIRQIQKKTPGTYLLSKIIKEG